MVAVTQASSTVATIEILLNQLRAIANGGFTKATAVSRTDDVSRVRTNV